MFSSLGDEDTATTMNEISGIASGIGSIIQGIASLNPAQVISGITGIVSSIANAHDSRLTKAINNSKLAVQELKNRIRRLRACHKKTIRRNNRRSIKSN